VTDPSIEQLRKLIPEDFDESAAEDEPPIVIPEQQASSAPSNEGDSEQRAEDRPETQGAQP
jgi:hypothetical protein